MRRQAERIVVERQDGRLVALRRGCTRVEVEAVLDTWVVRGRWWAREEERTYFRLATQRGTVEVYHSHGRWCLSRVLD